MLHLELTEDAMPLDGLAHTVRDTASRLGSLAGFWQGATANPADETYVLTTGLLVSVSPAFVKGQDADEDPFLNDFGMARAATVDFTYDSRHEGFEQQLDQLLQMVFELLDLVPGDALLHYEYYVVHLARLEGQLILSDDDDMWPPEDLVRVPVPYQRSHLAFRTM